MPPGNQKANVQGQGAALWLYQMIGAPLHALVQAEAQSAATTAEFIRDFGFEREGGKGDDLGNLRMARFRHERDGPNGPTEVNFEVPFLSMVPIPAMQIKDAELEFFIKVIQSKNRAGAAKSIRRRDFAGHQDEDEDEHGAADPKGTADAASTPGNDDEDHFPSDRGNGFEPPERVDFLTTMASQPKDSGSSRQSLEMQIKMKIRVEQADLPSGLGRVLNMMEQSVRSSERPVLPRNEDEE